MPEGIHVIGIAIYNVSSPYPELRLYGIDLLPEFGLNVLIVAGAKSYCAEWLLLCIAAEENSC